MNTLTTEPHQSIGATARHALEDVKHVAQTSLLQPLAQGSREVAHTAQSGAQAVAQSTRYELARLEEWAARNPARAAAWSFGFGIFAGIFLFRR